MAPTQKIAKTLFSTIPKSLVYPLKGSKFPVVGGDGQTHCGPKGIGAGSRSGPRSDGQDLRCDPLC